MALNELNTLDIIIIGIGVGIFFLMLYICIISLIEKETHAASRAFGLTLLLPLPYLIVGIIDFSYQTRIEWILITLTGAVLFIMLLRVGNKYHIENDTPCKRIDERDIMFSRSLLEVGSKRFDDYYRQHPDKMILDDRFRANPGLLSSNSNLYNPFSFASADASFFTVESMRQEVDGIIADEVVKTNPKEITRYIKERSLKLGALNVGVTELKDYHLYSHVGRGENYGKAIERKHKYAIAFTVEMDRSMIRCAPEGPIVMESAQQYLAAGAIAVQVAAFIRNIGYPARAHIDGNYHVVCPLVARDAGLGEIGRMGLLMTKNHGPRVRISVVTTDLPLVTDKRVYDSTMIDFCTRCKKCAEACPVEAIPFDDREEIECVKRWQISSEACYTFWCFAGTDCGRCISVFPYSHPNNLFHNVIRFGVRNSYIFRRLAIPMDDFLYGKKPNSKDLSDWMKIEEKS